MKSKHGAAVLAWTWSCWSREIWVGFFRLPFPQISVLSHKKQRQQVTQWKNLFFPGLADTKTSSWCTAHPLSSACRVPQGVHGQDRHWDEEMVSISQSKHWKATSPATALARIQHLPLATPAWIQHLPRGQVWVQPLLPQQGPPSSEASHLRHHQRASTIPTPQNALNSGGI